MNLFATHPDPRVSVTHLDDLRLRKMVLETAQILCTILKGQLNVPYRPTHEHHPVVKWAKRNVSYVAGYFAAIHDEYVFRFGKEHLSYTKVMPVLAGHIVPSYSPQEIPANCSGYDTGDVYRDYALCLLTKWDNDVRPPKWTKRAFPTM